MLNGGFEVVGVADPKAELRERCSRNYPHVPTFATIEQMLEAARPDAVVIATPPATHCALAIQCMEAGADVLIEKPMALSVAECDRIVQVAEKLGRKVM